MYFVTILDFPEKTYYTHEFLTKEMVSSLLLRGCFRSNCVVIFTPVAVLFWGGGVTFFCRLIPGIFIIYFNYLSILENNMDCSYKLYHCPPEIQELQGFISVDLAGHNPHSLHTRLRLEGQANGNHKQRKDSWPTTIRCRASLRSHLM
jgi:hypothetical protein